MENHLNNFLVIGGIVYNIDQKKRTILPINDQGTIIREKEMTQSNAFLVIGFDRERMELTPISKSDQRNLIKIHIPRQAFDDVNFPKDAELTHFNNLSKQFQWGVTFLSKELVSRIHGTLPVIDVAGVRYDLDIEGQLLRTKSKNYPDLSIGNMEFLPDSGSLIFVYNRDKRCAVDLNDNLAYSPHETFYIELEDLASIDPVGAAKRLGLNEGAFILPQCSYRPLHHAKATTLDRLLTNQSIDQFLNGTCSNNQSFTGRSIHNSPSSFGASVKR